MSDMIDTMVLIYGVRAIRRDDSSDLKEKCQASAALIGKMPNIIISAVSLFEFKRGLDERDDAKRIAAAEGKFNTLALDAPAAAMADALLRTRTTVDKVCRRCLSAPTSMECKTCKLVVGTVKRINDAFIVATAETSQSPIVTKLYSFDTGVLAYAPHVKRCKIERPQTLNGPLFEKPADATPEAHPPGSKPEPPSPEK